MFSPVVHAFLSKVGSRTGIIYLLIFLLVLTGALMLGHDVVTHLNIIEARLTNLGAAGYAACVIFFVMATSLFIPESLLAIAAGLLFGFEAGLWLALSANIIAASLQYTLARSLFKAPLLKMIARRNDLLSIQQALYRRETTLQFLLRLTPMSPALLSYLLGAVGVRYRTFLLASVGIFPHVLAEVYVGYLSKHIAGTATPMGTGFSLHDLLLLAGFTVTVIVVLMINRIARQAIADSMLPPTTLQKADKSE